MTNPDPIVGTPDRPAEAGRRSSPVLHAEAALDGLHLGLLTFDRDLNICLTNGRLATLLQIPDQASARAVSLLQLIESSTVLDEAAVQQLHEACLSAVNASLDHATTFTARRDGPSRSFAVTVSALHDGSWMATFQEVTSQQRAAASAIEQAMHDPLTGLPNRQLFTNSIVKAIAASADCLTAPPAAMLIDLDRFKAVNDSLGHPVGDGLLRLVARRLRTVIRADDVVARLGGDEFGLLIASPGSPEVVTQLATRIVDVLSRPYLVNGHLVNSGASIGVAFAPDDGDEPGALLRSADLALYHAKNMGRGTYSFFERDMDTRALARRSLEIDLRKALVLGEFELHYQPQIDLHPHAIVGFEALLRWRHNERGLVPPGDFVPLAEEIGLIVPIGEWVMREACQAAAHWPEHVSVAVNVSPHEFSDTARLLNSVKRALLLSGLPGSRLEVEITESVLLRNEDAVLSTLHALRKLGVRIAMDDFGTGYSSLSQLHSFPFDRIKIDRSFVKERGDTASQGAVIRAIAALGSSLGMSTIAEGVETEDQLDRVRGEGCNSVQGYLISRPIPLDQVSPFLISFQAKQPNVVLNA